MRLPFRANCFRQRQYHVKLFCCFAVLQRNPFVRTEGGTFHWLFCCSLAQQFAVKSCFTFRNQSCQSRCLFFRENDWNVSWTTFLHNKEWRPQIPRRASGSHRDPTTSFWTPPPPNCSICAESVYLLQNYDGAVFVWYCQTCAPGAHAKLIKRFVRACLLVCFVTAGRGVLTVGCSAFTAVRPKKC